MTKNVDNVNIEDSISLMSPEELKKLFPASKEINASVIGFREEITEILDYNDPRLLFIVGPCSIHNTEIALEYAQRLAALRKKYAESLCLVMRVYFEKPRTSLGWRGFLVDPHLDGSYNIHEGIKEARRLLLDINKMGLPVASEVLDPVIPQYIADLISWVAIGARTTESQIHRELSSGLSMPVGFKNGTEGDLNKAVNAIRSAQHGHSFIGINQSGRSCIFRTRGNRTGHMVMRGGAQGPNYYEENIETAEKMLSDSGISPSIVIDCSHANSGKNHKRQARVLQATLDHRENGHDSVRGLMLESNLHEGRQDSLGDISRLQYGVSITDACIGWEETEKMIAKADALTRRWMKI